MKIKELKSSRNIKIYSLLMLIILAIIVLPVSETVFLWMYGFEILIVIFFSISQKFMRYIPWVSLFGIGYLAKFLMIKKFYIQSLPFLYNYSNFIFSNAFYGIIVIFIVLGLSICMFINSRKHLRNEPNDSMYKNCLMQLIKFLIY